MTNAPPPDDEQLNIQGPAGESIFCHTKVFLVEDSLPKIQGDLDSTWVHYRDLDDDRLLVLVAALCIEGGLDDLLLAIAPGVDSASKDRTFSFSVKVKMAKALRLIPERILRDVELIGALRNQFAHRLDHRRFDDLPKAGSIKGLLPAVRQYVQKPKNAADLRSLFKELTGLVLMALRVYVEQTRHLRRFMESPEGMQELRKWVARKKAS